MKDLIKLLTIISSIVLLVTMAGLYGGWLQVSSHETLGKILAINVFCSPIFAIVDAVLNFKEYK